jgi:hypothetical protein
MICHFCHTFTLASSRSKLWLTLTLMTVWKNKQDWWVTQFHYTWNTQASLWVVSDSLHLFIRWWEEGKTWTHVVQLWMFIHHDIAHWFTKHLCPGLLQLNVDVCYLYTLGYTHHIYATVSNHDLHDSFWKFRPFFPSHACHLMKVVFQDKISLPYYSLSWCWSICMLINLCCLFIQ